MKHQHIILGGTGHVGSALTETLLARGESVTLLSHDEAKAKAWEQKGAKVAIADIHDPDALRRVFKEGTRAFLLNPPADPAGDTDVEERRTVASILAALEGSGLKKVVAHSTYGAQAGEHIGDLGVLYEFEQGLAKQSIPFSVMRAAYYLSNWEGMLELAQSQGMIQSFFPADFQLPMVAPQDLGHFAAQLMTEPVTATDLHYVEGPKLYTPADVAAAFSQALHKPVKLEVVAPEQWVEQFKAIGFSETAAQSYAGMTRVTVEGASMPQSPERGSTTLQDYINALVERGSRE